MPKTEAQKTDPKEVVADAKKSAVKEALPFTPKVKRRLTYPLIKMALNTPCYLKITCPMFVGKAVKDDKTPDEKKKEPATLLNVVNLATGGEAQIIVNTVLKSILDEEYTDQKYVGLCFAITKLAKREGKDYNGFEILEIEDPTPETPAKG